MEKLRNRDVDLSGGSDGPVGGVDPALLVSRRGLTARSVVASTLLGASPPHLPVRTIVRCGALFGFGDGAVRTAVSRMLADGSLEVDSDRPVYRVGGRLRQRLARQAESRSPEVGPWDGSWIQAVATSPQRSAPQRRDLRLATRTLRMAPLRQGIWLRPDNLDHTRHQEAWSVVVAQCDLFRSEPVASAPDLAARLWDLGAWADGATQLTSGLQRHGSRLDANDPDTLADGFVLSASVLRHLLADPLLPTALVPDDWPADGLRRTYDDYDLRYKAAWREWFSQQG